MRDPSLEEMAAVLEKAQIRNGSLRACCPAHGGEDANLSLTYRNGKLLATCHSHECAFEDIMAAIRNRLGENPSNDVAELRVGARKKKPESKPHSRRTWEIRDASGKLVALHVRDDLPDGEKKCWWRLPSGKVGLEGRSISELPLYGAEDVARAPWVVVAEGEKAADALRDSQALQEAGIGTVGTVTGAAGTPSAQTLSVLRGKRVVLWPDHDTKGIEHMGRIAQSLDGVAAEVRWFDWEEAPEKGDAADHPDIDSLGPVLKLAPRWSRPPAIEGRALIGRAIELGVEPPEELLPDMLLSGKAHNIYAPGGVGKTWLLVWIATELVKAGKRVVVFDLENGLRTYAERFEEIGADPKRLDELLHYYPFPMFNREAYEKMLNEEGPDIVMFDSWIGFLAADGRDENVSNDISAWADAYSKPALRRSSAVLVLDHVPHDHERERGSSRKRDEMDVVWKLTKLGEFDRDRTATLAVSKQKDREGWLPERLTFEIGGTEEGGFVMRRDDDGSRLMTPQTSAEEKLTLGILIGNPEGLRTAEWQKQAKRLGVSRATFYRLRKVLIENGKVVNENGVNRIFEVLDVVVSNGIRDHADTSDTSGGRGLVSQVSPPKGGVIPAETGAPPENPPSGDLWSRPFTELSHEEKIARFKANAARAYREDS